MKIFVPLLVCFLFPVAICAQSPFRDKPVKDVSIPGINLQGDTLDFAFTGGLNNCQFGTLDVDMDGISDLVIFDRHGNRMLVFLRKWKDNQWTYSFTHQYQHLFPAVTQWMLLHDYNHDGHNDLFTYTTGGIKVYRNESGVSLDFRQVTHPYLVSQQGPVSTNILVTSADYPAVADIDRDGDSDILTFWGLGAFVQWHKNLSMETYGTADSLIFEKVSDCWGHFAEGEENNAITLDTCMESVDSPLAKSRGIDPKHTGSTLLAQDFNGDGLPDLALGDVDFPGILLLTNGGTLPDARMTSFSELFPPGAIPVSMASFPAVSSLDVDQDGSEDLLVSPFDPSLIRSETSQSAWFYKKNPTGEYQLVTQSFLQGEMFDFGSGAYPVAFDYNGDGLTDLLAGNYGALDTSWYDPASGLHCEYVSTISLLENVGTDASPIFRLADNDIAGLSSLRMQSLIPAIGDLDGDGQPDLLCGNSKGKLVFCRNTAELGQPARFELTDPALQNIDVGDFSAPQIIDLDGDLLPDLVMGKQNGKLSYYHNSGSAGNPYFELVSDTLGGVNVTNSQESYYGYSVPCFYTDRQSSTFLLVGSESGSIYCYGNITNNLSGTFESLGMLPGIEEGWRTALSTGYFTNDTVADIIIGNYSGGLGFYRGFAGIPNAIWEDAAGGFGLHVYPNPACDVLFVKNAGSTDGEPFECELWDAFGHRVARKKMSGDHLKIELTGNAPGIYLLSIRNRKVSCNQKIVIIR